MKDIARKQIEEWYSAPAEQLERDLNTLRLFEPLEKDELDALITIGDALLDAKNAIEPPKAKVGRPKGSKTRKEATDGQGS